MSLFSIDDESLCVHRSLQIIMMKFNPGQNNDIQCTAMIESKGKDQLNSKERRFRKCVYYVHHLEIAMTITSDKRLHK